MYFLRTIRKQELNKLHPVTIRNIICIGREHEVPVQLKPVSLRPVVNASVHETDFILSKRKRQLIGVW